QIPSKYHKLIGMRAMEADQWETALKHLERSTELYAKAGNETRIKKCRIALAKQTPAVTGAQ
ncbi:phage terminase small subunit, partial [Pseudomonas sp. SDT291_1_S447]